MKEHPHHKGPGMAYFERDHWQKKPGEPMESDLKYTSGEMENPEHLKESVNKLSSYVKKHKMKY